MRKNRELYTEDLTALVDNSIYAIINMHNSIKDDPFYSTDRKKAMQKIYVEFPAVIAGERHKNKADASQMVKRHGQVRRHLPQSCARLREIRLSLGISQESFASHLGIPTATLLSYEYGRTSKVPEHVMEQAEEIFKQEHATAKRNMAQAARPMSEIVTEWAEMLKVAPDDFKAIADIVGVAKSTVHRWMGGEMRPRPRELNGYIRVVKLAAKRIEAASKAISEIY